MRQFTQDEIKVFEENLRTIKYKISQDERIFIEDLEGLLLSPLLSLLKEIVAKNPGISYSVITKLEEVIKECSEI